MISLIVVDYKSIPKTLDYIKHCYANIVDSHYLSTVIVDNSEDSSVGLQYLNTLIQKSAKQILVEEFPKSESNLKLPNIYECMFEGRRLLYVCAEKNLGYAKGNNLGAWVSDLLFKNLYYIFSNNDLRIPNPISIEQLLNPMKENASIAIVGPNIMSPIGQEQNPKKRKSHWITLFLYYYEMLLPKKMQKEKYTSDIDNSTDSKVCDWVSGCFLCVDAVKFREVKGFDEYTFLFAEELIIAKRLEQLGYVMYYYKDSKLIHEHGETVKSTMNVLKGIRISFESILYYYVEYEKINRVIATLARVNFWCFTILFSIKKRLSGLKLLNKKGTNRE